MLKNKKFGPEAEPICISVCITDHCMAIVQHRHVSCLSPDLSDHHPNANAMAKYGVKRRQARARVQRPRFPLDSRGPASAATTPAIYKRTALLGELHVFAPSPLLSPAPLVASPFPFHPSTVLVGTQGSILTGTSRPYSTDPSW